MNRGACNTDAPHVGPDGAASTGCCRLAIQLVDESGKTLVETDAVVEAGGVFRVCVWPDEGASVGPLALPSVGTADCHGREIPPAVDPCGSSGFARLNSSDATRLLVSCTADTATPQQPASCTVVLSFFTAGGVTIASRTVVLSSGGTASLDVPVDVLPVGLRKQMQALLTSAIQSSLTPWAFRT